MFMFISQSHLGITNSKISNGIHRTTSPNSNTCKIFEFSQKQASLSPSPPPSLLISEARNALLLVHPTPCLTRRQLKGYVLLPQEPLSKQNQAESAVPQPDYGRNLILPRSPSPPSPNHRQTPEWCLRRDLP